MLFGHFGYLKGKFVPWQTIKDFWVLQIFHSVIAQLVFFKHTVFLKVQILHSGEKGASKRPGEKKTKNTGRTFLEKN